jgi:hypothetical protein
MSDHVLEPCANFFHLDGKATILVNCKHDKASHYSETENGKKVYFSCLCNGCDCKKYVNPRGK